MASSRAPNAIIQLRHMFWLLAGLALVVAPHLPRLPWWLNVIAVMLFAWRIYLGWGERALPKQWLLALLVAGGVLGVFLTYHTIFGRDSGVALLVLFLSLKLFELQRERDAIVLVLLSYFLALTNFFYSQTLPTAALMLVSTLVNTASLVNFAAPGRALQANLKTAGVLLAQAGPVMLILFFLFPRVQGPLWGLPQDAYSGVTGLSDSMSPGAISRLSQSDAIAFRVKFAEAPPPKPQLYWRGPVFWNFDGRTWRPGDVRPYARINFEASGKPYDYEVTLEPHNHNWLFALEMAAKIPPNASVSADHVLFSRQPVRTRIRYDMRSYTNFAEGGADSPNDLRQGLQLPAGFDPRARALAQKWAAGGATGAAIAQKALDYFRERGFVYTLDPPLLGRDSVDDFLFGSKRGFCEHYASSFVFLMRAAGVPARVVTGYQGGEINPVDGYMIVRQSDAHAWAEIWLSGRGWVRVDPTAAVSPLRVEAGVAAAVPATDPLPLMTRTTLHWLLDLRYNWDALANKWNQLVLGYNPERQRQFLARIGMSEPSWENMALTLFWGVGGLLALLTAWLLRRMRSIDPAQRLWLSFCAKLGRDGCMRAGHEGPVDFIERTAARYPARAGPIRAIGGHYIALRYGESADAHKLAELRRLVREFSV
ncbi:MAG: transglutaminase TgpA family protein [Burkholderiales bacterium]